MLPYCDAVLWIVDGRTEHVCFVIAESVLTNENEVSCLVSMIQKD